MMIFFAKKQYNLKKISIFAIRNKKDYICITINRIKYTLVIII